MSTDDTRDRRQMIADISNQDDNISRNAAANLVDAFGDLEAIEEQYLEDVLDVRGVGPKMAEKLGVWDEDGEPVGRLVRYACPICHEAYEERMTVRSDTTQTLGSVEVCVEVPQYARDSVVLYVH